jgi:primosomal protein N'
VRSTQKAALELLAHASAAGLPVADLRERGVTADTLRGLAKRGLVTIRSETDERDPFPRAVLTSVVPPVPRQLTDEQSSAFDQLASLADAGEFRVALLHGVTGSGKTEIYLRLADRICRSGRQVLVMVPEIALTPTTRRTSRRRRPATTGGTWRSFAQAASGRLSSWARRHPRWSPTGTRSPASTRGRRSCAACSIGRSPPCGS